VNQNQRVCLLEGFQPSASRSVPNGILALNSGGFTLVESLGSVE